MCSVDSKGVEILFTYIYRYLKYLNSVSYTHLDVYKRQSISYSLCRSDILVVSLLVEVSSAPSSELQFPQLNFSLSTYIMVLVFLATAKL